MTRAIIFANGVLHDPAMARAMVRDDDFIIAADNGAAFCKQLNIMPHAIIGDMDSIDPSLLAAYEKKGVQIIRLPADKNETDLELALAHARATGVKEALIFGAFGDRWDMTLANALTLAHPSLQYISVRAVSDNQELTVIHSRRPTIVQGMPGDTVSLIPLTDPVEGVTLNGFRYPLKNENVPFGSGRGMSNELLDNEGSIDIKKGVLLCIITRKTSKTP